MLNTMMNNYIHEEEMYKAMPVNDFSDLTPRFYDVNDDIL